MQLKMNVVMNFIGQTWATLIGLIFVPLYIKFMGIESYGLVGFYTTLVFIINYVFDFGFSATINRELARRAAYPHLAAEMRSFVRTLEVIYWLVGLLVGFVIFVAAPIIAGNWLQADQLPLDVVNRAIMLMGLIIVAQWPMSFYQGGLMGLEKQALFNTVTIIMSTVRAVGAVLILWLVSPSVIMFFTWQAVISSLQVIVLFFCLWHSLPPSEQPSRLNWVLLVPVWRFAAGVSATSLVTFSLSQLDKLVISKMFTLEVFGYYTLASTVANALRVASTPILNAVLPRLSNLVASGDISAVRDLYHKVSQFAAVAILPAALIVSFFSYELLLLWTQNEVTARMAAPVVSVLVFGTSLNGIDGFPYSLQLAFGWTRLCFSKNLIAVILMLPLTITLAKQYGGVGAAWAWCILNIGYLVFEIPVMHRRLLRGEMGRWYLVDLGLPFIAALVIACLGRWVFPAHLSAVAAALGIVIISSLTLAAAALAAPYLRAWLWAKIFTMRRKIWNVS